MATRVVIASILTIVAVAGSIRAAPPVRLVGESRRTAERLDGIADLIRQNQPGKAIDMALLFSKFEAHEWVAIDRGQRYISVREFVLNQIRDNESTCRLFRERFESKAIDLLRRALASRDVRFLHEIVTELAPTKTEATALELLGDWQFENGDFSTARHWWQRALPRVDAKQIPVLRAKLILATAACGEPTDELRTQWNQEFPDATGQLAGKSGRLSEILQGAVRRFKPSPPKLRERASWPDERLGRWIVAANRVTLPGRNRVPFSTPLQTVQRPNISVDQLTLRPVVWRDYIVTVDGPRISAIQIQTAKLADVFSLEENTRDGQNGAELPTTIAIDGPRVMTRLSATSNEPGGRIVCLDQDPNADDFRWRIVWQIAAKSLAESGNITVGTTPVVRDGHIYFTWTQVIGSRRTVWISSYASNRITDGPRWSVPVVEETGDADGRILQPLVLAGPNVVYVTNAGLLVAIDAVTGRPAWAMNCTSQPARPTSRDHFAETLVANGRLFVAPTDSHHSMAIDVWTGQPLWARPQPLAVRQILGIIDNQVIVAVDQQWRGLAAINTMTGKLNPNWGSLTAAPPYGRGVLLDDRILFPTRHAGIAALNYHGDPISMPVIWQMTNGGNIVFDKEAAVIAGAGELTILRFERGDLAKID